MTCRWQHRGGRRRRGAALLLALAVLVLLTALAIAVHAVTLRERRSARRATLQVAAGDAADAALTTWRARLANGDSLFATLAVEAPGTRRVLEDAAGRDADARDDGRAFAPPTHVRVTFVTLGGGTGMLVSEATATAGALLARRRVAFVLVADSTPVIARDTTADTARVPLVRRRLLPAPERAWVELP